MISSVIFSTFFVVPVETGIQEQNIFVVPAQAGIQATLFLYPGLMFTRADIGRRVACG
jgi:hypothetical protein